RHGRYRLTDRGSAATATELDDERIAAIQHETLDPACDSPHCGVGQRARSVEYASALNAPVNALGGSAPLLLAACRPLEVRRLRPNDGLAIAPSHHEQPVTSGGRTIVSGDQPAPLDRVSHAAQDGDEPSPGLAGSLRV